MDLFGTHKRQRRAPDPEYFGADGLRARPNGPYAKEKLGFLDDYIPLALRATERKRQRWYVDLFAGPGINVNPQRHGDEWLGSSLRALGMKGAIGNSRGFDSAVLVNLDERDHCALASRIDREAAGGRLATPRDEIDLKRGDSNTLVRDIMGRIHIRSYAFVVADIEAPTQLPWSTIAALREQGHVSVDLYVLFPLAMGLNRMLGRNKAAVDACSTALNSFFGNESWRSVWERKQRHDITPHQMRSGLIELYLAQLRAVPWKHVGIARDVHRTGRARLYHMLYATDHDAGGTLAKWAAARPQREAGQVELF